MFNYMLKDYTKSLGAFMHESQAPSLTCTRKRIRILQWSSLLMDLESMVV